MNCPQRAGLAGDREGSGQRTNVLYSFGSAYTDRKHVTWNNRRRSEVPGRRDPSTWSDLMT